MELNQNSWHKRFYEFWWQKQAPNNLCNYFWGLVIGLCTLLLFPGRIVDEFLEETEYMTAVLGIAFSYFLMTIAVIFISGVLGGIFGLALFYPGTALSILGAIGVIIGLIWWYYTGERLTMASKYIKAKKDGVCPRIDWT